MRASTISKVGGICHGMILATFSALIMVNVGFEDATRVCATNRFP
jgi:hypothetical protein